MSAKSDEEARLSDDACGKLWEIYLGEAHRYDEGLVKSWKEDMDVILVFSGLYSAVLTAFVIESYKTLQPDQTEVTSSLLLHISQQLASGGNETAATVQNFTPDPSAVACNILWFLSLTLALSCAFLATFVQQWTRYFLHRTTILRTPTSRARLFSYLYFGLKYFKMHTIVDVIPSVLHVSLFLFLGGLVAFLHTVNSAVRWLIVGALVVTTCVYAAFTIMPLFKLSSPYQTPLSPMIWRLWQSFMWSLGKLRSMGHKVFQSSRDFENLPLTSERHYNLTYAMVAASYLQHEERETKSLVWTLRSLTDDYELLPFVEALPDVIFGINGRLHTNNFHLLRPLLETTDPAIDIISRTVGLISNAPNYWMTDAHRQRCAAAVPRGLWALAYLLNTCPNEFSLKKTGRPCWFSNENVSKFDSQKWNMNLSWYNPATALIKSSTLSCKGHQDDSTGAYALEKSFTLETEEEQARNLMNYTLQITEAAENEYGPWMFESTFFALKGHWLTHKINPHTLYNTMMRTLISCGPNHTVQMSNLDRVFRMMMMICDKTQIVHLCEYVKERTKRTWAPLPWLWFLPETDLRNKRKFPNGPGHKRLIRAILDHEFTQTVCVDALRGVLWCFDRFDKSVIHPDVLDYLDQTWWSEVDPVWFEVVSRIEDLPPDEVTAAHESLAVMVKAMVLKKIDSGFSSTAHGWGTSVDPMKFLRTQIGEACIVSWPPDPQTIISSFTELVIRQLELMDPMRLPDPSCGRDTLNFLQFEKLLGAAYTVSPELAHGLAVQTLRLCEGWRSNPAYTRDVLEVVWVLWEPEDTLLALVAEGKLEAARSRSPITQETARAIGQAAQAVLGTISSITTGQPHSEDNTGGAGPSSAGMSENPDVPLIERVRKVRRLWEDLFPYLLPLPPCMEFDQGQRHVTVSTERQEVGGDQCAGVITRQADWLVWP